MSWEVLLTHIGLINFAVTSALSLQVYRREGQNQHPLGKIAFGLFLMATLATTAALALHLGRLPFHIVAARGLVLAVGLSWFAVITHIWLRMRSIAAFVAPAATLTLLLHFFVNPQTMLHAPEEIPALFLAFHIAGATMGQVLALAASVISVLYLWQQHVLKQKLFTQLTPRLPALDLLEKILVACLWAGFLFLTLALISGAVYIQLYAYEASQHYYQKIAWAITVWVWYLSTLLARNVMNLSIKHVAQMSLIGFALLATTFFGMAFFENGSIP